MELTKEYFDQVVLGLATKEDLKSFATKDDLRGLVTKDDLRETLKGFATKDDLASGLKQQTTELKAYVMESFEIQQVWMDERFKELIVPYDLRKRVAKLEAEPQ